MAGGKLRRKEVPWCTVFLVVGVLTCHTCVLVGNLKTSESMTKLGQSTHGWSQVGIGISRSLASELDDLVQKVNTYLLDSLSSIVQVSNQIEDTISEIANATDAALNQHSAALLQVDSASINATEVAEQLRSEVMGTVQQVLNTSLTVVNEMLDKVLVLIKPALEQLGEWMVRFGEKVMSGLESFSVTLDKVQKIFDQVMAQLSSGGKNFDDMVFETWGLFNLEGTDEVTAQNLADVGRLYVIQALTGTKPAELVEKYDHGKGHLNESDITEMVQDPSIPGAMAVMLRRFATKLSEVGGEVGAGRLRSEVSMGVAKYFQLICAKNESKLEWVSDALGNGSLPEDFTSAVYAQLCLTKDSVDKLTTVDTGKVVINKMYELHPSASKAALDLMSNTTWWPAQGFNSLDQPGCVKTVTIWLKEAVSANHNISSEGNASALLQTATALDIEVMQLSPMALQTLTQRSCRRQMMQKKAQQAVRQSRLFSTKTSKHLARSLLGSEEGVTSSNPNVERVLNGGEEALPETLRWAQWLKNNATTNANIRQDKSMEFSKQSSSPLDSFSQMILGMAKKITNVITMMEKWSTPAGIQRIEDMVKDFVQDAEKEVVKSINTVIDNFINESMSTVEGAVNKVQEVATDVGNKVEDVAAKAGDAVEKAQGQIDEVAKNVGDAIDGAKKNVGDAIDGAKTKVGDAIDDAKPSKVEKIATKAKIAKKAAEVAKKVGDAVGEAKEVATKVAENVTKTAEKVAKNVGEAVANTTNVTEKAASILQMGNDVTSMNKQGQGFDDLTQRLVSKTLPECSKASALSQIGGAKMLSGKARLAADRQLISSARERFSLGEDEAAANETNDTSILSMIESNPIFETVIDITRTLTNLLPTVTNTLKEARTGISQVSQTLLTVFEVFDSSGPPIFDDVAYYFKLIWVGYYILMWPLALGMLYYGFWAGGYFGGPQPITSDLEDFPQSWWQRFSICCRSCNIASMRYHDTNMCIWSTIIFMQVLAMLIFVICIVLCLLAGIQAFIGAACSEVYILGDATVCTSLVEVVKQFLNTFHVTAPEEALDDICPNNNLLTCGMIQENLVQSAILTTVFSFLATGMSLQMLIESAVLHEQAKWRRLFNAKLTHDD